MSAQAGTSKRLRTTALQTLPDGSRYHATSGLMMLLLDAYSRDPQVIADCLLPCFDKAVLRALHCTCRCLRELIRNSITHLCLYQPQDIREFPADAYERVSSVEMLLPVVVPPAIGRQLSALPALLPQLKSLHLKWQWESESDRHSLPAGRPDRCKHINLDVPKCLENVRPLLAPLSTLTHLAVCLPTLHLHLQAQPPATPSLPAASLLPIPTEGLGMLSLPAWRQHLTRLRLDALTSSCCRDLAEALPSLPHLAGLTIKAPSSAHLRRVLAVTPLRRALTSLTLAVTPTRPVSPVDHVHQMADRELLRSIPAHHHLRHLSLTLPTKQGYQSVCQMELLQALHLDCYADKGCLGALPRLSNLTSLDLYDRSDGNSGVSRLTHARQGGVLKELSLRGQVVYAAAFHNLRHVTCLRLGYERNGLHSLAVLLPLTQLVHLDLKGAHTSDELAVALSAMPHLTHLGARSPSIWNTLTCPILLPALRSLHLQATHHPPPRAPPRPWQLFAATLPDPKNHDRQDHHHARVPSPATSEDSTAATSQGAVAGRLSHQPLSLLQAASAPALTHFLWEGGVISAASLLYLCANSPLLPHTVRVTEPATGARLRAGITICPRSAVLVYGQQLGLVARALPAVLQLGDRLLAQRIDDGSITGLTVLLRPQLRHLALCNIQPSSTPSLDPYPSDDALEQLATCTQLTHLQLPGSSSRPSFTSIGLRLLADSLSSLRVLGLEGCYRLDEGCLQSLVRGCPQLQSLRLDGLDRVGEAGLLALGGFPELKDLSLGSPARLTLVGLMHLLARVARLTVVGTQVVERRAFEDLRGLGYSCSMVDGQSGFCISGGGR